MRDLKDWLIGAVIVIAFALVAFYFYSNGSIGQSLSLPTAYTGPVNVSAVALEINYASVAQQCFGKSVEVLPGFTANNSSDISVLVTLTDSCGGTHDINSIGTDTLGFYILSTNPPLSISMRSGDKLTFNVTVKAPAQYSGVLNIIVSAS